MTWVTGVFDNFLGLPLTPSGIEVLDGREFGPVMYWPYALPSVVLCRAVAIPSGDATHQDALIGAAVELFEDLRAHAKSFQPPEVEEPLLFPLYDWVGVFGP